MTKKKEKSSKNSFEKENVIYVFLRSQYFVPLDLKLSTFPVHTSDLREITRPCSLSVICEVPVDSRNLICCWVTFNVTLNLYWN